jgi:hypothetical protein
MTDRPLYRPGETVRARLVLREVRTEGQGRDARFEVVPAADRELRIGIELGKDGGRDELPVRTDASGLARLEFEIPATAAPCVLRFESALAETGEPSTRLGRHEPCRVAAFVRPAIRVSSDGPRRVPLGSAATVTVGARAEWASGGPAAGVPVTATVEVWRHGRLREERALRTDPTGRVALPIEVARLGPGRVEVRFHFASPDGRDEVLTHDLELVDESTPPSSAALSLSVEAEPIAGEACAVTVRGPADGRAMLVAGRGRAARLMVFTLDDSGTATVTVTPQRDEWPFLDLCAATAAERAALRVPFALRARPEPRIELPDRVAPGAEVTAKVRTGSPGSLVTLALVDERIFTLEADRSPDPAAALRPRVESPAWRRIRNAEPLDAGRVLADLMSFGAVPPLGEGSRGGLGPRGPSSSGTGGPAMAGGGDVGIRDDFRPTAVFETAVCDAEGIARFAFRMPDDLSTWRATVVGVDADGAAFVRRAALVSARPLAAEPLLPRVLRAGDRFDLPVLIDRGADADDPAPTVEVSVRADGAGLGPAPPPVALAPGRSTVATIAVRTPLEGALSLDIAARVGDSEDHSRRTLAVAAGTVRVGRLSQAAGQGRVEVQPHPDSSPGGRVQLQVFAGDLAVRDLLDDRLTRYPYGCVEQTLSALLPFFAASQAAKFHGLETPAIDEAFADRLGRGLGRLAVLQVRPGGAFAWWPGGEPDLGMTALVVHGLCAMRAGGLDPSEAGLRIDLDGADLGAALRSVAAGEAGTADSTTGDAAELAAAALRWAPEHPAARAAAAALQAVLEGLPPGLALRLGIAWTAAGDPGRAEACLRAAQARSGDRRPAAFPGEAPLAVRALALELAARLGRARDEDIDALIEEVLAGLGSTYAEACCLTALALCRPAPATPAPVRLRIAAGAEVVEGRLDAAGGFAASFDLAFAPRFLVEADGDLRLRAILASSEHAPAATHPGWSTPLVVERELLRVGADGRVVPLGDSGPRVGEPLAVRLRVATSEALRYALIACPLPAGLELPFEPPGAQRFDDRVAFAANWLRPGRPFERMFRVVATHSGRTLWPPATASSMYVAGCEGGSPGGWLTIGPATAEAGAGAAVEPVFAGFAPQPEAELDPEPETALEASLRQVEELWWTGFDRGVLGLLPEPAAGPIDAARRALAAIAATPVDAVDLPAALDLLTDTIAAIDPDAGDPSQRWLRGAAWAPWRSALDEALRALHQGWTAALIDRVDGGAAGMSDIDALRPAIQAVAHWPVGAARERAQARLLDAARLRAAGARLGASRPARDLLGGLEGPAATPELRTALLAATADRDATVRELAVAHLPLEDLATLPATVLIALQFDWLDPGIVTCLVRSPEGRTELLRRCAEPGFVTDNLERLRAELPDALWAELPIAAFAVIAGWDLDFARACLGAHGGPDARLRQALATAEDPQLRALCAEALRRRGAAGPGAGDGPADRGPVEAYRRILAAAAAGEVAKLAEECARVDLPWSDRHHLLELAARGLADHAGAEVLADLADRIPEDAWGGIFVRLPPADLARLLDTAVLPELPTSTAPLVWNALWRYGLEHEDLDAAIEALCRTAGGAAFAAGRVADLADPRRKAEAEARLEEASRPWRAALPLRVLHLLRSEGPDRSWTPAERRALDEVLALRGLR